MSEIGASAHTAPLVESPVAHRERDGLQPVKLAEGWLAVVGLLRLRPRPGEVLHPATPVGEPSLALADDTAIASGELVEITDRLMCRVIRFGSRHG